MTTAEHPNYSHHLLSVQTQQQRPTATAAAQPLALDKMAGISQLINTSAFLTTFLTSLHTLKPSLPPLPAEVQQHIIDLVIGDQNGTGTAQNHIPPPPCHPAAISPASGSSPFMNLSTELRRSIFVDSLPPSTKAYRPRCKDAPDDRFNSKLDPSLQPRRNSTSDLMILNKKICGEITEVLYEGMFPQLSLTLDA